MKPIPVVFHIGPLQVHTYGVGLALTFWFGYRYFARRLRAHGYEDRWLATTFVWIVVAAVVGARAVHVVANWGHYSGHLGDILLVWRGGLSSFGGLALAVPVGLVSARRRYPSLRLGVAGDLVAPVLVSAWAMGRILGPQLMEAGGGKPTTAWFGMYYAGEPGKRLPVPIFQAIECLVIFAIALVVERWIARRGGPVGVVTALSAALWGLSRFFDEFVYLGHDNGTVAVEVASLCFFGVGIAIAVLLVVRGPRRPAVRDAEGETTPAEPWDAPTGRAARTAAASPRS